MPPRDAEATRRRLGEAAAAEFAEHGIAGARFDVDDPSLARLATWYRLERSADDPPSAAIVGANDNTRRKRRAAVVESARRLVAPDASRG